MAGAVKSALCGKCKVALEGPADPEPDSMFSCPSCGEGDHYENVVRIIHEFAEEATARFLQNSVRGVARGSKFVTFKGKAIPKREHRFIIELDL